jgi:hypothetical protein
LAKTFQRKDICLLSAHVVTFVEGQENSEDRKKWKVYMIKSSSIKVSDVLICVTINFKKRQK